MALLPPEFEKGGKEGKMDNNYLGYFYKFGWGQNNSPISIERHSYSDVDPSSSHVKHPIPDHGSK